MYNPSNRDDIKKQIQTAMQEIEIYENYMRIASDISHRLGVVTNMLKEASYGSQYDKRFGVVEQALRTQAEELRGIYFEYRQRIEAARKHILNLNPQLIF